MLTKFCLVKAMVFPVVMHGCEICTIKKAEHQRIDAFELWSWRRLLRVLWTARRSNHHKGNQSWIFTGRTDAEAETPVLWPPDAKNWLIGKDPDAGKDWGQEEKGTTEDEMAGWHHWLDGYEFEQTPGDGGGQGSLVPCSPWVAKSRTRLSDWTTLLKQLLNRTLKPSISRVKMSGNSYFGRACPGPQSIDCGRNQKWLARPPSDSAQSFGAQGQLSLRATVWWARLT